MKGIDFLEGLNEIDLEYIQEAEEDTSATRIRWGYYVSLAACLALMVTSGVVFGRMNSDSLHSLQSSDGVASMISSPTGLFWMAQIVGGLGIALTIFLLVRSNKKHSDNEGDA